MVATAPIRTHEKETGALPLIVAMTANSMKGVRDRYLQAGMDGYVS